MFSRLLFVKKENPTDRTIRITFVARKKNETTRGYEGLRRVRSTSAPRVYEWYSRLVFEHAGTFRRPENTECRPEIYVPPPGGVRTTVITPDVRWREEDAARNCPRASFDRRVGGECWAFSERPRLASLAPT